MLIKAHFILLALFLGCQKGDEPLRIYSSMDAKETRDFTGAYEKASGAKVEFVRLSTGEALARIRAESKNPQVAVWIGGGSNEHVIAGRERLLQPYQPRSEFPLTAEQRGREGEWNGWYMGVIGFGSNTDFLKKNNLQPPRSYQDLLKPVFRGKVAMAYPYTAGTAYTILTSLISMMGEDRGFQFFKSLDRQVTHYTQSGSACVTQVGLGEIAVCIAFSHDIGHKGIAQGYPIVLSYPEEGAGYEVGGVSLVRGGPGLEAGKKFVDWLYRLEAQNKLSRWNHIPLHPEAIISPQAEEARRAKRIPINLDETADRHETLLTRWREVTGR